MENTNTAHQKFDAILIDEAQDLNSSFLKLAYGYLKEPKRLIYAYDELQKLNEGKSLPNPEEIFGREAKDTILNKCYRNSRPLLTTAHSLGFGIYKKDYKDNIEMVQFFDQPELWSDVGYDIIDGKLKPNNKVALSRTSESSPIYLEQHTEIEDLIIFTMFENKEEQAIWIANSIETNLREDELLHSDIIVINPLGSKTKTEVGRIREILNGKGINSHIAGDWDPNVFFEEDSITFTGINRAKGNEVAMVYIINTQECHSSPYFMYRELISRRNTLFTAITRSKAWVRVCGTGSRMQDLIKEFSETKENNFILKFTYPTDEQISNMNIIHRDLKESEKSKINSETELFKKVPEILTRLKKGETLLEDYPKEIRKMLRKLLDE